MIARLLTCILCLLTTASARAAEEPIQIGSKAFTESVILADIATQAAQHADVAAEHRQQLGGTRILWSALLRGEIDIYPEYTGTIAREILSDSSLSDYEQISQALARQGIRMTRSLGFNNTYAVGMRESVAQELGITTISDLRQHPELHLGFSNEFMDRADGWPGLRARYALPQQDARGMDHDLAYRALESGVIAATDLYSTDAEISYYRLRVLRDDIRYFPDYQAVYLYRDDLRQRSPKAIKALEQLEGRISQEQMIALNAKVKLQHTPEPQVAAGFLAEAMGTSTAVRHDAVWRNVLQRTREHLFLVSVSLLAAIVVAVPLGIAASKCPRFGQVILGLVATIYTIPSLALLVFMLPLLGIGARPAIVALFLYSLLPIVRNTPQGLRDIPQPIAESAEALGLPGWARLLWVELPMASGTILAGIKTAAVINIGTATLGALIGAGGYGQPILTGIRLDSISLILQGAVPAALMALAAQWLFELGERLLVPRGLRVA